jgi:hypothetical protein
MRSVARRAAVDQRRVIKHRSGLTGSCVARIIAVKDKCAEALII